MWYHVSLSTEVMLAISQQIPFVEQQRAATVAAELAEQQPQAKRQQETRPPHCEEPQQGEGGRGGVNLFDHALQAQQRQEEQPQAPQQPQQPQQPQPPGEEEFKMRNPSVAQVSLSEPPKLRRAVNLVIQQLAQHRRIALEAASARRQRARSAKQAAVRRAEAHLWAAQAVEGKLRVIQRHVRARALAKAARIKAEKKRAKKERQKAKRAAVWALPGRPRNTRTLRRKHPGVLCGAFARAWRALSRNGPGRGSPAAAVWEKHVLGR
jgi:hypothetical protein